ncbi:MAG: LD-carboxypeptidase [Bacteroidales bacterium]|nr:LD-carboxypeptidase [Bacteroidales bacterium]
MCKPLRAGDLVAVVAPARKISEAEVACAVKVLEDAGLRVAFAPHLYGSFHQFSGTDAERLADFQWAVDKEEVKAVWCARGGYGGMRIVDSVDFSRLRRHPKWICGYSDTTAFHVHLQRLGLESLHCTMPVNVTEETARSQSVRTMLTALTEGRLDYTFLSHPMNRPGEAEGVLCGGNLSLLYAMQASPSDLQTEGKILFIEDLDEYLYHIDRMMLSLKRSGKLSRLAGLVVGNLSDMHDNTVPFGQTAEEIVWNHVAEYHYPVCFGFPAGHADPAENHALIFGRAARLSVGTEVRLTQ